MVRKLRAFAVRNESRLKVSASAAVAATGFMLQGLAAHATDPCNGTGVGPGCVDYATSATAFQTGITPILTSVLPISVAIMAIWTGPRLFRSLLHGFLGH